MDRLELILGSSPQWGAAIVDFLINNPEFRPYLKYVAIDEKVEIPSSVVSIKDMLLYYACCAGVNANYGIQAYEWVCQGLLDKLTTKKRATIDLINQLPTITTKEEFEHIKIKGVGDGAMTFVRQNYFNDKDIIYPTDRIFQRGIAMIYGLDTVTVASARDKANLWKGQKSVGSMFCFQVANYHKLPFEKGILKLPFEKGIPKLPFEKGILKPTTIAIIKNIAKPEKIPIKLKIKT